MSIDQELQDKISSIEGKSSPEEIVGFLETSKKYPDVGQKVREMRLGGTSAEQILGFVKSAKATPTAAPVAPAPAPEAEKPGYLSEAAGELGRGIKRGLVQAKGMAGGLAIPVAEAVKTAIPRYAGVAEQAKQWGIQTYKESEKEAAAIPTKVPDFESVKGVGDFGLYVAKNIGEQLPMWVGSMGAGGVGALAGRKIIQGTITKMLAEGGARGLSEDVVKDSIAKSIASYARKGALTGAGAFSLGMETGQIAPKQIENKGELNFPRLLATAIPAAALDVIGEYIPMSKILRFGQPFKGRLPSRIVRGVLQTEATEIPTEVAQGVLERAGGYESVTGPEAMKEYKETAYSIAAGTLPMGIAGGVPGKRIRPTPANVPGRGNLADIEAQHGERPEVEPPAPGVPPPATPAPPAGPAVPPDIAKEVAKAERDLKKAQRTKKNLSDIGVPTDNVDAKIAELTQKIETLKTGKPTEAPPQVPPAAQPAAPEAQPPVVTPPETPITPVETTTAPPELPALPGETPVQEGAPPAPIPETKPKAGTFLTWLKGHGIWDESLPGETREFGSKESGIVGLVKKGGKPFDELLKTAIEDKYLPEGASQNDLMKLIRQEIQVSRGQKEGQRAKPQGGQITLPEGSKAPQTQAEAEAQAKGFDYYGEGHKEDVGDLKPGDKLLIKGEEYEHKGFDKEGNAIIEDGEKLKLDPFEKVEAEAVKPAPEAPALNPKEIKDLGLSEDDVRNLTRLKKENPAEFDKMMKSYAEAARAKAEEKRAGDKAKMGERPLFPGGAGTQGELPTGPAPNKTPPAPGTQGELPAAPPIIPGVKPVQKSAEAKGPATVQLADKIKSFLKNPNAEPMDYRQLFVWADEAFGGTQAEGKYTPRDAYDAMEMGVNKYIGGSSTYSTAVGPGTAEKQIAALKGMMEKLPTQSKRTEEQVKFQQFSTPPSLSYAANWVAKISKSDIYLEPSAGTGGLAIFGKLDGAKKVIVNELSRRRARILSDLGFSKVLRENAEQLNNILPADIKPTLVVMNPPFSATAGRMETTATKHGAQHVEQALKRLVDKGRLVAIVGEGMALDKPTFRDWWKRIEGEYNVKANIGINGEEYRKYGTTFDNQILVIDKTGPTTNPPITGKVDKIENLIDLLKGVRDERGIVAAEQIPAEPAIQAGTETGERGPGPELPIPPATGKLGPGEREVQPSAQGPGVVGERDAQLEAGGGGEPPGTELPGGTDRPGAEGQQPVPGEPGGGGPGGTGTQVEPPHGVPDPVQSLEVTQTESGAPAELSDSVYETYKPKKVIIAEAQKHPAKLVESAAMASVDAPDATYRPHIPKETIKSGKLSAAQLESIVYAGQAHSQILPGETEIDGVPTKFRKGFQIGDGTGVGKGREISGIILDNWNQGRKKAIWISQNSPLIEDARRDMKGIGADEKLVFPLNKVKLGSPLTTKEGVVFLGYDLLKAEKDNNKRIDQLVDWFGKDFDGVVVFDESHNLGNAIAVKGTRGTTKPSAKALAGVELQRRLPNARVLYVSATGATEVMNLSYTDRLGLWGDETAFDNKRSFIERIASGGIAAMEMVAQNMKAMGNYISRSLSYDDVKYEKMEYELTDAQREIYNELARAWQVVLQNINAALGVTGVVNPETGASINGRARGAAYSAFWGAHQRFFNQIITSMQTPVVISGIEKDLQAGHSAVIQLVNTNEAAQERALSRLEEDQELEDLDMTPRDQLMDMIRHSFPVIQFEQYTDEDGNVQSRPVVDSQGNQVVNPEAVAMREALLDRLGSIRVPDGPLEMILNHFGTEKVAEVTGRTKRVVYVNDEKGHHLAEERRSQNKAMADADAFANDKKSILIFSYAGGTGRSYHADLAIKNQRMRRHYLLQAGWRADRAIQGFGRTHRTNQKQAPEYVLVTTNLKGQKRFISSIARRLDQLGALTRGQRQTGGQGFFTARDNLESQYAQRALVRLIEDLHRGKIEGMSIQDFENQTGIKVTDKFGNLNVSNLPDITRFLNRILSMTIETQDKFFDLFSERMDQNIRAAMEDGTLDQGLETLRAKRINKIQEQVVHTHEATGAKTKYVELEVTNDARLINFKDSELKAHGGYVQNIKSGRIWALAEKRTRTDQHGNINDVYKATGIDDQAHQVAAGDIEDTEKYARLTPDQAKRLWEKEYGDAPKEVKRKEHLIAGALLPIWDRISVFPRIMRVQTEKGERFLGRVIDPKDLAETLNNLGATQSKVTMSSDEVHAYVLRQNYKIDLANGWSIIRRRVSGEDRIELTGPTYTALNTLRQHGVFVERINYTTRSFIPTSPEGVKTVEYLIKQHPIVQANPPSSPAFSLIPGAAAVPKPNPNSAIMQAIRKLNPRALRGESFVSVTELRDALKKEFPDKEEFDSAIQGLVRQEILMPAKHSMPADLERTGAAKNMVPATRQPGQYWNGLAVWPEKTVEAERMLSPGGTSFLGGEETKISPAQKFKISQEVSRIIQTEFNMQGRIVLDLNDAATRKGLGFWGWSEDRLKQAQENGDTLFRIAGRQDVEVLPGGDLRSIITVATAGRDFSQVYTTSMHEAFHAVQRLALNDNERAILAREFPNQKKVKSEELQAQAFADFCADKKLGIPSRVSQIFQKIRNFFNQLSNYLQGLGFKSADDIFMSAYAGEYNPQTELRPTPPVNPMEESSYLSLNLPPSVQGAVNAAQNSRIANLINFYRGKIQGPITVLMGVSHGPQIGHWFRNMESILSQTKWGRVIYEAARHFKFTTIAKYTEWERKYHNITKGLTEPEKQVLLTLVDSTENITGNSPVEQAGAQLRALLQEVRKFMVDNNIAVGYIEGYFPHIFEGKFWIKEQGEMAKKVESLGEALQIAKQIIAQGGRPVTIMQDTFIPPTDATQLTRKSFWKMTGALRNVLGQATPILQNLTQQDVAHMLVGNKIARPMPKKRFFGNLLPRLKNNPNFSKNIDDVFGAYFYGASRKVSQDKFLKTVQNQVESAPTGDQKLKKFVQDHYLPLVLSHPTNMEEAVARALQFVSPGMTGQDVRNLFHRVNLVQYAMDMGISFTSAVANASQFWMNIYPIIKEMSSLKGYWRGLKTFKNHSMLKEVEEMGVTSGVSSFTGNVLATSLWSDFTTKIRGKEGFSGILEATLEGFNAMELINRFGAYWGGKDFAHKQMGAGRSMEKLARGVAPETSSLVALGAEIDRGGTSPQVREMFAKKFAFELNEKGNFRVGRENLPMALSEAPFRFISPYKSFLLNQLKYTIDTVGIKGWMKDPVKALRFLGMSFALGGIAGNSLLVPFFWAFNSLVKAFGGDDMERWLKRAGWYRGISGAAGLDISGSVAMNMPNKWEDLMGRFGKVGLDLYNYLANDQTAKIYSGNKLARESQPAMMQRAIDAFKILRTGEYRSPITQTPMKVEDPTATAIKRLMGIFPQKLLNQYDIEKEEKDLKLRNQAKSEDIRMRFALAKTDKERDEVMQNFTKQVTESLNNMKKARTEMQTMDAMTDLLFWKSFMDSQKGFEMALLRTTLSREITKFMGLPKYMRPQAAEEMQMRKILPQIMQDVGIKPNQPTAR